MLAAFTVAAVAMFAVGFLPTWAVSRRDLSTAIKDGGQSASAGLARTRLRSAMTVVQVAGSCVFLLLAAVTARGILCASTPGFDFQNVAVIEASLAGRSIDAGAYWRSVRQAVASNPETEEVAMVQHAPLGTGMSVTSGLPDAPHLDITNNMVEAEFFKVMRIPIVAGRNFTASDRPETETIISRRLAMEVYGTLNVIGQTFPRMAFKNDKTQQTIVGIAEDAHSIQIANPNAAEWYLPWAGAERSKGARLIARARTDARSMLGPMREASRAIDDRLLVETRLLTSDFRDRVRKTALTSGIALSLAMATLLLACIGIFGVISYGASLRRKEISIRLALGAGRSSLIALLMRQSAIPAVIGLLCGFGVGFAGSKDTRIAARLSRIAGRTGRFFSVLPS